MVRSLETRSLPPSPFLLGMAGHPCPTLRAISLWREGGRERGEGERERGERDGASSYQLENV
jgi:hypothetical protein